MCGIAGQFGVIAPEFAENAVSLLKHRGPDGHGVWEGEGVALVHTRLAIIELSDAGRQPMKYGENGSSMSSLPAGDSYDGHRPLQVLVFNGEIYNHAELRADLEKRARYSPDILIQRCCCACW